MLPYLTLITIIPGDATPIYLQIADQLIALIRQGRITTGAFLPGTRELAGTLQVHRNTVIKAYDELIAQGWLQSLPRKGFQVVPELPLTKPRSFQPKNNYAHDPLTPDTRFQEAMKTTIPTHRQYNDQSVIVNDGFPDVRMAPFSYFMKVYYKLLADPGLNLLEQQPDLGGLESLKHNAAQFLNQTRGLNITADHLLIARGAQMAIYIAAALLLQPGDAVITTDPNYFMADEMFRKRGASIHRVPVDNNGMDVDQLEQLLTTATFKLLYVIPHHHHPTTVTMSAARRQKLLALIKQYQLWVIEDDYDYDFHYQHSPILPLASTGHEGRIVYIGSFTKLLAPSLRIGYLVAGKEFIKQAVIYKKLVDLRGDTLMEAALSDMIHDGELARHIKRTQKIYAARLDLAIHLVQELLSDAVSCTRPQGGMALWLSFKKEYPLEQIFRYTAAHGVYLQGSAYHSGNNSHHNGFRFGFASLNEQELRKALLTIKQAITQYSR
ncbi:PLP-dependent aminotransferase family protein [Chitinophaga pendula]|uniref:MocR-like pyridoxine biosynthesis transcription factor PdxR n=1 Tax=Chitinophaga TaxID=79328 RepID=UPI000BAFF236|nr:MULTISPECIES: PLP-dependent aminotransferase family protein [Chitinophaga]ASZ13024.1 GntR family transcriptional regulator [Chitinophaga sp. MD30]UCJ09345.1 PLP-dependent aminotransferase family protein [Chitinophaga pendula]